jgi:hypothetical protein
VLPILTSALIGVAAKIGIGLAASAAKRLFSKAPATATVEPPRTFAEELERARPLPTVDAPLGRAAAASGLVRAPADGESRPLAPATTTDRAQLALAARVGRRKGGARAAGLGRQQLGAYRRIDLAPR